MAPIAAPSPQPTTLLSRKEVMALREITRSTLYRWQLEGLPIVGGRIDAGTLAWWLELRDAAKLLEELPMHKVWALPREAQSDLMTRANALRGTKWHISAHRQKSAA